MAKRALNSKLSFAKRHAAAFERALIQPAQPLAALRIAVALIILVSPELWRAAELARNPFVLDVIPQGLGWLAGWSVSPGMVRVLQGCVLLSGASAALGYWSRLSMCVLTLSGALVFSFSQRAGAVFHDMHVFWLGALLSVSRCGDACALDARGKPGASASLRYGLPAALARLLLGFVYLFPGLCNLQLMRLTGRGAVADLIAQLHAGWFLVGRVPPLRVDHFPMSCVVGAWLVIAFQLSFVVLAQCRKTRWLAVAVGLAFHFGCAALLFGYGFNLWPCYVVLLPLGASAVTLRKTAKIQRREPALLPLAALCVGSALVLAEGLAAARGQSEAWPFALYPTFTRSAQSTLPDLQFEVRDANGQVHPFTGHERAPRTPSEWRRVLYLANAYASPTTQAALYHLLGTMAARAGVPLRTAARASIFRVELQTAPEAWGAPPVARTKLWQLSCEGNTPGSALTAQCRALRGI